MGIKTNLNFRCQRVIKLEGEMSTKDKLHKLHDCIIILKKTFL